MELDIEDLEPKLKEILYRCLEDVRATKAAVYLLADSDDYGLATQYGFRDGLRAIVNFSDDMVDQLVTRRTAYFINGLAEDSRFSEVLFDANTTRLLVAPIYSRGKLVGFIDLRDKAGKEPFKSDDIEKAQKIADQFLDLFAKQGLYGQKVPTLTNVPLPKLDTIEPSNSSGLSMIDTPRATVEDARTAIKRGVLNAAVRSHSITEDQFRCGTASLPAILGLDHVVLAGLSAFSVAGSHQEIVAHGEVTVEALDQYDTRLQNWLHRRGETASVPKTEVVYPFGLHGPRVVPERLASLLSAPVNVRDGGTIVLSIAFDAQPDQEIRTRLERFLVAIQKAIENAMARDALDLAAERVAERLLEPDFERFPALAGHSRRVADLCERLARAIGLPPDKVEHARICGLVHDVGMRLLDYGKLYRSPNLTADQLRLMREHTSIGAALVAESALGVDVARVVYSHHERPDGTGYPDGLTIDEIPIAARIVHICESYDAMTAQESYQNSVDSATALAKIRRASGTQFDPDLASRFAEMIGG